jgi:hypothetical protein
MTVGFEFTCLIPITQCCGGNVQRFSRLANWKATAIPANFILASVTPELFRCFSARNRPKVEVAGTHKQAKARTVPVPRAVFADANPNAKIIGYARTDEKAFRRVVRETPLPYQAVEITPSFCSQHRYDRHRRQGERAQEPHAAGVSSANAATAASSPLTIGPRQAMLMAYVVLESVP